MACAGLKGLIEERLPWIFWSWCMAYKLELAIRDAFKGTMLDLIDEILLRLYMFIYENSSKKCQELEEICSDLKECLSIDTEDGGVKPIQTSSSR